MLLGSPLTPMPLSMPSRQQGACRRGGGEPCALPCSCSLATLLYLGSLVLQQQIQMQVKEEGEALMVWWRQTASLCGAGNRSLQKRKEPYPRVTLTIFSCLPSSWLAGVTGPGPLPPAAGLPTKTHSMVCNF